MPVAFLRLESCQLQFGSRAFFAICPGNANRDGGVFKTNTKIHMQIICGMIHGVGRADRVPCASAKPQGPPPPGGFFSTVYSKFKVIQSMVSELAQRLSSAGKPRFLAGAAISAAALLLGPGTAQATGFEGHYAFGNWTQSLAPGDTLPITDNTAGASDSVTLYTPSDNNGITSFTIRAAATGDWTFGYQLFYQPGGEFTAGYIYTYNAVPTPADYYPVINQNTFPDYGVKFPPIEVTTNGLGELPIIGFYLDQQSATDFPLPRAGFTITFLDAPGGAPTPAPEPSSLALLAIGAMGLRMARRAAGSA